MPWMIAVVVNAGVAWVACSRPWAAAELASADFVAADGPFSISVETNLTAERPAICEVHQVRMSEEVVPVYSSLPVRGDGRREPDVSNEPPERFRARFFPHSERHVTGAFARGDVREARVHICPECRRAEAQWHGAKGVALRLER